MTDPTETARPMHDCSFQKLPRLQPGQRVGHYVVDDVPRCGGFAAVYRCRSSRDDGVAAVKVLNESRHDAPRAVRRFEQEIDVIRRIRHPNIVEIIGTGSLPDGRPYYVMEWLDGVTLGQELMQRGPLLPADTLPVLEELCDALSAAHAAGVVHRDIKPDNIIALPSGSWFSVKLLDFGIAKLLEREEGTQGLTSVGRCLGTAHYMSPEQILCDRIDPRTDVYSLGILIYRMITGLLPFHAPSRYALQMMHLDDPPPRAGASAPAAAVWDDVLQACMAKAPSQRPQTVKAMLEALRSALSGSTGAAARERITIQIEAEIQPAPGTLLYDRSDARADALERAADSALAAGCELLIEADDAVIAACDASPAAPSRQVDGALIGLARRIVADEPDPEIVLRVWLCPEGSSPPARASDAPLPAGVYVAHALLPKHPPPPPCIRPVPGAPHFSFIPHRE
ncbi:serine/threonine protein kinase [Haliangium sp.]|uniref:serine/threonine protein kinase n=1 Tax=Haliangium sp. TaxID=2663208 RepID=UPI003D0E67D3